MGMAEFQVPVREGKDDLGTSVRVEIAELDAMPETAAVFRHPELGTHQVLHWQGRLLRPFSGNRGASVDVAGLADLLSLGQTANPFGARHWRSPFEPNRF